MGAAGTQRGRKVFLTAAKAVLAAGLAALVLRQVQWDDTIDPAGGGAVQGLKSVLTGVHWPTLVLAVVVMFPSSIVAALRWRMLLAVQSIVLRPLEAFKLAMLGDLFANVLPGTIGGDAIKMYLVARTTDRKSHVLVSVLADRAIGLAGVVLLAWTALAVAWGGGLLPRADDAVTAAISLAVVSAVMAAAAAVMLSTKLRRVLGLQSLYSRPRFARHAGAAGRAIGTYRSRPGVVLAALGYTLISQALVIGSVGLIGASLSLGVGWHSYAVGVPLVEIVAAVPVTPGAVGMWEGAGAVYFAAAENASGVLAMVLLWRVAMMACSLPGLAVAVLGPKLPRSAQLQAELEATGVAAEAPAP